MVIKQFRGALASPHINFFNKKTYELTALFAGWDIQAISPYKTNSKIINYALSFFWPHLYLVAKNDTSYRYHEKKLKEWQDDDLYKPLISIMNPDTKLD